MSSNSNSDDEPFILGVPRSRNQLLDSSVGADPIVPHSRLAQSKAIADQVTAAEIPMPFRGEPIAQQAPLAGVPVSVADHPRGPVPLATIAIAPDQDRTLGVPHRESKHVQLADGEKSLF